MVAQGYGGRGVLIDRSNEGQLEEVFKAAQKDSSSEGGGHSVLLNCLIGKTSFREGSISV